MIAAFSGWIAFAVATDQPLDFNVYYLAAEVFARGDDPYRLSDAYPSPAWDALAAELGITHFAKPYRYPPHTAAVVMVLRPLGPVAAAVVWECLNAVGMVLGAWLLGRLLGGDWWIPASLAALLFFAPAYGTLLTGQVNGLIFLSLVLALSCLIRGRDASAGISLAVGGVLKLVPFVLVPYLLLRRRWRLAWSWLFATAVLTVICLPFVGWGGMAAYLDHAVDLTRPGSVFTGQANQTLTGVLGRALDPEPARALAPARVAALVLLVATAGFCRPVGDAGRWLPLEFSVVVALLGLVFPFTWYHQLLFLLIPFLVIAQELVRRGYRALLGTLIVLYALTSLHFIVWSSVALVRYRGWGAGVLAEVPFLFGLCLWLLGGLMLVGGKRRSRVDHDR